MPPQYFSQPAESLPPHLRVEHMGRAEGNLTYTEMIRVIRALWEEALPDIPLRPVQGPKFSMYPVIVHGIEVKVPEKADTKKRIREYIKNPETGQMYQIKAQRFRYIVTFKVITENEPDLAEDIMERFEDFMDEITPALKELGVSEIFYGRRQPDSTENRSGEDTTARKVAYEIYLEKVYQIPVAEFEDITIRARVHLERNRNLFTGTAGDDFIEIPSHDLEIGATVLITATTEGFLPLPLRTQRLYEVVDVDETKVYLVDYNDDPVTITADGVGRLSIWRHRPRVIIEDERATPNY
jgi:hypothetical protein